MQIFSESLINLSVSVIIFLFSVKSKLSSPYNRVLRVKGAMCIIAFWSVTLGLLYERSYVIGRTEKTDTGHVGHPYPITRG